MAFFSIKFKVAFALVLTAALVTIGVLNLRDRANHLTPSDGVTWREVAGSLEAASVDPQGVKAGLAEGDILVSISGKRIGDLEDYYQALYELGPDAEADYRIRRPGSGQEIDLKVYIAGKPLVSATDIYRVIVAFTYLAIGLYILARSWRQAGALHFYLICLFSFVLYLFHYTDKLDPIDYVVYWCSSTALLLLPALFVHFCLRFPVKKEPLGRDRLWPFLIYFSFALLLMAHVRWFAGKLSGLGLPRDLATRELIDKAHISYFSIMFALGAIALLHTWHTARSAVLRQQMKWITRGAVVAIAPFLVLYVLPYLFGFTPNAYMKASILSLALIPLSFGYAISRYKLMDVDIIFKRGAAYVLASSTVLCIYFLLIVLGGKLGELLAPQLGFIAIAVSALVTAFLFAPLRNAIQARIDKLFYKDRYDDRRSLIEFAKTLSSEISLPVLTRLIIARISKSFDIGTVVILLREDPRQDRYLVADALGFQYEEGDKLHVPPELFIDGGGASLGKLSEHARTAKEELARKGLHYFQPLLVHGRLIGLIGLGRKAGQDMLSSEDLELLDALSGYAAIALENANLYKSVEDKAYEYAQLKAYSENIIESINVGVMVLNLEGKVTSCNAAFEALYGALRQQIIGRKLEEVFSRDFIESLKKALGTSASSSHNGGQAWILGQTTNLYRLYLDTRKGTSAIVNLSLSPLIDRTDNITGTLLVFDDITERVMLEDQLLQAEKLSSIGLLAAGIAHEINTPIAGICSYTQMLLKQLKDGDPQRALLEKIEKQTFRASEIVNSLLNFSRLGDTQFRPVNVNWIIRESLSLLEHQLRSCRIQIVTELAEDLPPILGNQGKLQQVFINLFLNAKDAMPEGGTLRISTARSGDMVIIDVTDTGVGIPPENLKRIYDPFFTTKEPGKGTGLGLAVSYGIIQEHSGRIFVESEPGKGTSFRLKFPIKTD